MARLLREITVTLGAWDARPFNKLGAATEAASSASSRSAQGGPAKSPGRCDRPGQETKALGELRPIVPQRGQCNYRINFRSIDLIVQFRMIPRWLGAAQGGVRGVVNEGWLGSGHCLASANMVEEARYFAGCNQPDGPRDAEKTETTNDCHGEILDPAQQRHR